MNPGRGKDICPSPKGPYRLWGPPMFFPGGKAAGAGSRQLTIF